LKKNKSRIAFLEEEMEKMKAASKESGSDRKADIHRELERLRKEDKDLFSYAITFPEVLSCFFEAYRTAATGVQKINTDRDLKPWERFVKLFGSLFKGRYEANAIQLFMKLIYKKILKKRFFEEAKPLLTLMIEKSRNQEEMHLTIAEAALQIVHDKGWREGYEDDDSIRNKLREHIKDNDFSLTGGYNHRALEDVWLLLIYIHERLEDILKSEIPLSKQFSAIIIDQKWLDLSTKKREKVR